MFRKLCLVSFLVFALFFTFGCSDNDVQQEQSDVNNEIFKVGILQIVEHPALDEARKGFLEGLKDAGYEEGQNIKVDYQNAQNDQSNLQTMAKKLVTNQMDIILAIGTNAAIALANETTEIPILITAVTDPLEANLVENLDKPGRNITGTTDINPIEEQIDFMLQLVPNLKKLGIIYNAGEVNSEVQVRILKDKIANSDIEEIVEATVATSSEVMQAAQSIINKVDALYIPTDNTVISAYSAVVQVAEENKKPLFTGEASMIEAGGIGTVSIEYFKLGQQTGEMAGKIIEGANPAEMPIEKQKNPQIVINEKGAERVGVEIPQEILDKVGRFIE